MDNRLLEAVRSGNLSQVKTLLKYGANITCYDPEFGGSPLHWACAEGHTKVAELLMDRGANINALNKEGRTPLIIAAAFGKRDAVALLLKRKADRGVKDKDNKTAFDYAQVMNHSGVVKLLKK
jgi:ankyrin repeat protein